MNLTKTIPVGWVLANELFLSTFGKCISVLMLKTLQFKRTIESGVYLTIPPKLSSFEKETHSFKYRKQLNKVQFPKAVPSKQYNSTFSKRISYSVKFSERWVFVHFPKWTPLFLFFKKVPFPPHVESGLLCTHFKNCTLFKFSNTIHHGAIHENHV